MLRIGIIGMGVIFPKHLLSIEEIVDAKCVAVADTDTMMQSKVSNDIHFYTDYIDMLEKENLDIVHICLPHYLHVPVAKDCMSRGVHVFTEKPMSSHYETAVEMATLEEKYNKRLGVCLQNRYNPSYKFFMERFRSNDYGKLLGTKGRVDWYRAAEYYQIAPWRGLYETAGSGVILNQAIHTLDFLTKLRDDFPVSIKAQLSHISGYDIEVEDSVQASFIYEDGVRGFFTASVVNHSNDSIELSAAFEKAKLVLRGTKVYLEQKGREELLFEEVCEFNEKFYYGNSHALAIEAFYKAVQEDTDEYIHAEDALLSMTMYEAMRRSSERREAITFAREF